MKIRNIVLLFILLLIGIFFYKIKEALTLQEADATLKDLNQQLDNAINERKFRDVEILQDKVSLARKEYLDLFQAETEERNKNVPIVEMDLTVQLELEKKRSNESVKNAINNQKILDKNNYDSYIEQNQGFFESLTNKAKKILSDQLNTISLLKQQAIDNNFIINDAPKKQVLNKTKDRYLDPECNNNEYLYCSGDKITCEDIFGNPLQDMKNKNGTYSGCGSAINSKSYSQFLDDMTAGLTVEGTQSVFYDISSCPSDKPWRVDISAGDLSFNVGYNDTSGEVTLVNSDFYKKFDVVYVDGEYLYNKYKTDPSFNVIEKYKVFMNKKVYYKGLIKEDMTTKPNQKYDVYIPDYKKRVFVDIENKYLYKLIEKNVLSGVYITDNFQCYKSTVVASGISKFNDKKSQNLYINSVVYVDGDYLYDKYNKDAAFRSIRSQNKIWVNNKTCYKGVIKNIRSNNNFDVSIPDEYGQVFYDISKKYLYTINLEYTNDLNATLTDLKIGSFPRPVCKNGNFTKKCSTNPPNDIEFIQTPDKTAYSADAFPLLGEGNEATCSNKLNFSPF
jgi:hypothetical protein